MQQLCNKIEAITDRGFESFSKDEHVFETVKNISYCIETLAEEFIVAPSSKEFLDVSKIYLNALENLVKDSAKSNVAQEQVIWAFGRQSSWLKWRLNARKNELERKKGGPSKLLVATMDAYTSEMLIKNEWKMFHFCAAKKNWREAAAALSRIFLENCLDGEKVCKAFLNLKFSILANNKSLSNFDSSLTMYELAARQIKILELLSCSEYEEKKSNISDIDWDELAAFESEMYTTAVDVVLFEREINFLNKVLNRQSEQDDVDDDVDDDACSTGSSCGSI